MSRVRIFAVLVAFGAAVYTHARPVRAESWVAMRVIVNAANPADGVDRRFLSEAFFKKTTRWPDEETIRPVDLTPSSPVRRTFSEEILKRPIAAVKSYWQQMVFAGHGVPPPELESESDVVKFVARNRGAVGYVSPGAALSGVKIIAVR